MSRRRFLALTSAGVVAGGAALSAPDPVRGVGAVGAPCFVARDVDSPCN